MTIPDTQQMLRERRLRNEIDEVAEWRGPAPCESLLGKIVAGPEGEHYLQVKCDCRASDHGFHYLPLSDYHP